MREHFEESIEIQASPDVVWGLVTDVVRHPEFAGPKSITKKIYFDGPLAPGAVFNADEKVGPQKFQAPSEIVTVDPEREFAWVSLPPAKDEDHQARVRWSYELTPTATGTLLNHTSDIALPRKGATAIKMFRAVYGAKSKQPRGMRLSLENIKAAAESKARKPESATA
jgi:hypothetical protein